MRLICGHCANYRHEPFHEDRCLRNGKIVGFLWERDCYTPKLNPNAESEQNPIIMEQDQSEMEQNNTKIAQTKVCKECGRELPIEQFRANYKSADGHLSTCNDCLGKRIKAGQKKKTVEEDVVKKDNQCVIKGKDIAQAMQTPPKDYTLLLGSARDQELVDELRARGWDVTCRRTIEL